MRTMRTALLPKEHGAYGQMAFPLVTALAVSSITAPALFTALAIVAGFLAHEPVLVLLGLRGTRAKRELGRAAAVWLAIVGTITIVAGLLALRMAPPQIRWSFAVPLIPAALLVPAIAMRQEKSWHAEVAVAITFSVAALPLCLASGSTLERALTVVIPFGVIFVSGTLAVRTVILRVRGGGDARASAATRAAVIAIAVAATALLVLAAVEALLPWSVLVAAVPGLLLSLTVALFPPSPARLKTIGWSLVAASSIAVAIIVAAVD
jgi:hypothetical protein